MLERFSLISVSSCFGSLTLQFRFTHPKSWSSNNWKRVFAVREDLEALGREAIWEGFGNLDGMIYGIFVSLAIFFFFFLPLFLFIFPLRIAAFTVVCSKGYLCTNANIHAVPFLSFLFFFFFFPIQLAISLLRPLLRFELHRWSLQESHIANKPYFSSFTLK